MNLLIAFLSLVGLWISIYFTGVFYKKISPNVFWMPQICQFKEATCMTVLDTPSAKMFGYPNSLFGILVYSYLFLDQFLFPPYLGAAILLFAVIRSIHLAYSLIYLIKIPCPLCFTSHGINIVLFVIYLWIIFV